MSTFVVYALANPLLSTNRATNNILHSKQAFVAANSSIDEVLYKMKNQMSVPSYEVITVGGIETEVSVSTTFSGRTVQVESEVENVTRRLKVDVAESTGVSFNYGLQTGRGGIEMSGSSGIEGNVYANGNIIGGGSTYITGSATAASGADPTLHQSNSGALPAPQEILFGGQLTSNDKKPEDAAQSFTVSTTTPVTSVRLYIRKYANVWMNDVTLRLTTNTSSRPGNTTLASVVIPASQVTTSYNHISLPFDTQPVLTPGTTYWLVLDTQNTWNSYYMLGANQDGYAGGVAKTGVFGGSSWNNTNPSGLDMYFDLFVGGETGKIDGGTSIGDIDIGENAWAHNVHGADVGGTLHCQGGTYINKPCDTSRPDPVPQPLPISDGNIAAWKAEAEAGGVTSGDVSYTGSTHASIGPRKIEGNLTVGNSAQLTINGTLWVTGNVTLSGSGIIKLADSYGTNSGIIVSDGRISGGGSAQFNGNGQVGSYMLVVTTSACPISGSCGGNPAVNVNGSAGSVILNAQKGHLVFSGSAHAKQATAEKIVMSGSTVVQYESGLADPNFISGPSGSWSISDWSEI
ncbi:MAG: choice-of-anchor R domain-containing protein [Candidatus Paceibacterota bacterium]